MMNTFNDVTAYGDFAQVIAGVYENIHSISTGEINSFHRNSISIEWLSIVSIKFKYL